MKFTIVSTLLLSAVYAAPIPGNITLTGDIIKKQLDPLLAFDKYIDEPFFSAIKSVISSDSLSEQLASLLNKLHNKEIKRPNNRQESLELLEKDFPELGSLFRGMVTDYETKFKSLSQPTQDFLNAMEQRLYKAQEEYDSVVVPSDPQTIVKGLRVHIKAAIENDAAFTALPPANVEELNKAWPKFITFTKSNVYTSIVRMLKDAETMSDEQLKEFLTKFSAFA